jgi:phosphoenolpyruvate-protein kinase (PTS system EI component)
MMIEVPAAALLADRILEHVEFLSIEPTTSPPARW